MSPGNAAHRSFVNPNHCVIAAKRLADYNADKQRNLFSI